MANTNSAPQLIPLDHYAVLTVTGSDAADFLQNQLSNDLNLLSLTDAHQINAYCNPKGRMLALLHVLKTASGFTLLLTEDSLDAFIKRFKMFIMRADVQIQRDLDLRAFAYTHSETLVSSSDTIQSFNVKWLNSDFQLLLSRQTDLAVLDVLPDNCSLSAPAAWSNWLMLHGQGELYSVNVEQFIPQELNMDLNGGVNFEKGCYPGQEIVARIYYRGKPKARMITAESDNTNALIGDSVFIAGKDSPSGRIVNKYSETGVKTRYCITLALKHLDQGDIKFEDGTVLERLPNAYPLI